MSENGFLGETATVTAVHTPILVTAGRTGCVRIRRCDPESQGNTIEVGPDQATADGSVRKLEQE